MRTYADMYGGGGIGEEEEQEGIEEICTRVDVVGFCVCVCVVIRWCYSSSSAGGVGVGRLLVLVLVLV